MITNRIQQCRATVPCSVIEPYTRTESNGASIDMGQTDTKASHIKNGNLPAMQTNYLVSDLTIWGRHITPPSAEASSGPNAHPQINP